MMVKKLRGHMSHKKPSLYKGRNYGGKKNHYASDQKFTGEGKLKVYEHIIENSESKALCKVFNKQVCHPLMIEKGEEEGEYIVFYMLN
jgi:hypothetical protein